MSIKTHLACKSELQESMFSSTQTKLLLDLVVKKVCFNLYVMNVILSCVIDIDKFISPNLYE